MIHRAAMRTRILPLFFILFLITQLLFLNGVVSGQERHFLCKVTSARNSVYLLGSIHILKEEHYPLSPIFEEVFHETDVVVFEANLDSLQGQKIQSLMLQKGMYLNGKTLKDNVSEETYALLEKTLENYGLPVELFELFRPTTLALTLNVLEAQTLGYSPEYGVDRYFFDKSKREEKEIRALESAEFQIELLFSLSESEQELYLKQTLLELDNNCTI